MKNLSIILNIVLLAAVIWLYVDRYSFSNKSENKKQEAVLLNPGEIMPDSGKIVYIDLEKILLEYEYSIDLNNEFQAHTSEAENNLQTQLDAYQKEADEYQRKLARGGFVSMQSAENQKSKLIERQSELQQLQQKLQSEALEKEKQLESNLYDSIINYLKEVQKEYKYKYVLSHIAGSDVLVADPELDITKMVLTTLNKRYQEKKDQK